MVSANESHTAETSTPAAQPSATVDKGPHANCVQGDMNVSARVNMGVALLDDDDEMAITHSLFGRRQCKGKEGVTS